LFCYNEQEVSLLDVRKEINFCKKVGLPIIGVIENMSGFVCPKCKTETKIFPPTTGGAQKMCQEMDVPFLGQNFTIQIFVFFHSSSRSLNDSLIRSLICSLSLSLSLVLLNETKV
jgi:hypothetical protein